MSITQETRREAYEQVEPRSIRMKIADLLTNEGGMTSSEIMERMGYSNPNTVRPRLTELKADGVIQAVGKRKNRYGANEAVWEIAV